MSLPAETRPLLAFTTVPDEAAARRLARSLLESRLVACVNLLPRIESMYWWQGQIESGSEWLLLMKTLPPQFEVLKQQWPQWHSYEVPELLAVEVTDGLPAYLQWLVAEIQGAGR